MPDPKMHADEADIDAALVGQLLAEQFPQWADLAIRRVESTGTDNAMFRIGGELCVRLPRIDGAVGSLRREQRWLPRLAARVPLAVPVPLAVGEPSAEYPYPWSVLPWIAGEPATRQRLAEGLIDPVAAAVDLAGFLKSLHAADTAGAPAPVAGRRGSPITGRDETVRAMVAELGDLGAPLDAPAVLAAWDRVMATPAWSGAPVWIHADLQGGNLLARDGRLAAVIDFAPSLGDPAVDLLPAWNLFEGDARAAFRAALGVDDDTWERGRGWALSIALVALPYYTRLGTNPRIVADSWHDIDALLKDA
ncbi:aminoglycoside phosphotransferase (APT) family kinase protein [Catenulispora sp. GAS73]|uniref:aminoglycoside phosphotransferase family protein n=1 Tax=Catenulispora sp. GAS73 TaxID=3156269 RepID=UPI0035153228